MMMRVQSFNFTKVIVVIFLFLASGCTASMFMKGGSLVSEGYKPQTVLVTYRAEGIVPAGVRYQLVQTEKGHAIFERSPDGSGTLFEIVWRDDRGEHFAGWVATSHGYEFIVPLDRSKPVVKYVYPKGSYSIKEIGGVSRPVPDTTVEPVARLIPQ
jgi:hypothetical protein